MPGKKISKKEIRKQKKEDTPIEPNIKDSNKENKTSDSSTNKVIQKWKSTATITKIFIIGVIAILIIVSALLISDMNKPTYEDLLIKAYESGTSQSTLTTKIDNHYNVSKEYLASLLRFDTTLINSKFSSGDISESEKNTQLDTANTLYQTSLNNLEIIKNYQIEYIEGKITAEELKKNTEPLYQKTSYLIKLNNVKS